MNIWPRNARLALSVVINVEEGAEYNIRDGDKFSEVVDEMAVALRRPIRNFGNESNYAYGIKRGGPRLLGLLSEYRARATFTSAAVALERAPFLTKAIVAAGHEVCAHGYRWIQHHGLDERSERQFIDNAVQSIVQSTGKRPEGWLSRYLLTENTRRILVEKGFTYHMDDYSDDLPFWDLSYERPILVVPYAIDTNDMKMWQAPAYTPRHWLEYLVDTFDVLYAEGRDEPRIMSVGLHLRIAGRPGRYAALRRFFEHVKTFEDVWIATRLEIAKCWASRFPPH